MKFALLPAGEFLMGSDEWSDSKPIHKVKITKPFYLGIYQVTQREWKAVMDKNPSGFKGDDLPVERVSWEECQEFIKKLNKKEGTDKYRLPTEAEWEYACRAGSTTKYYFGDAEKMLSEYAWYNENSGNKTHPVGQKKPNAFGLYDMHGNVWEWCQDWYNSKYYSNSPEVDPTGPIKPIEDDVLVRTVSKINCKYIKRMQYLIDYNWKINLAKPELAIIECIKQEPRLFYTKEIAVSALVQGYKIEDDLNYLLQEINKVMHRNMFDITVLKPKNFGLTPRQILSSINV